MACPRYTERIDIVIFFHHDALLGTDGDPMLAKFFIRQPRSWVYLLALLLPTGTLLLTRFMTSGNQDRPLLIAFIPSIVLSALLGGMIPGLVTTLVAVIGLSYFFYKPIGSLAIGSPHDLLHVGLLVVSGLLVSFFSELLHRTVKNLEDERAKLTESEERFRILVENAGDALYLSDKQGRFLDVNPEAERQTGYSREELLTMSIADVDSQAAPGEEPWKDAPVPGSRLSFETMHRRKDGALYPVEVRAAFFEKGGQLVRMGFARDITVRKQAEQKLSRQKNLLTSLVESTSDAISVKDLSGRYLMVNHAAARIFGKPADQVLGREDTDLLEPEQAAAMKETDRLALAADGPQAVEHYLATADGPRVFLSTKGPLYDERGDKIGLFAISADITDRKHIAEQMMQTEKMASVGGLAAGMAHEINNPLAGILMNVQVLKQRLRLDVEANIRAAEESGCRIECIRQFMERRNIDSFLNATLDAGTRAANIVNNMLEFSRKSSNKHIDTDLNNIIDKSIGICFSSYDVNKKFDYRTIDVIRDYSILPAAQCIEV